MDDVGLRPLKPPPVQHPKSAEVSEAAPAEDDVYNLANELLKIR